MTAALLLAALAGAAAPERRSAQGEPPVIVALGDSTTAGTPGFLSPLEAPPDGRGDEKSQYGYWLAKKKGWRVINRGVNGERTDEIRARFPLQVEASKPRAVVILGGVNDVYQGYRVEDAQANLLWMYKRGKALGITTVAATVLPFTRATAEQSERIAALNAWIRATAKAEGILFCDTAKAAADPQKPWRLKASPDGLHPDVATYRAVGEAVADCLK